MTGIVWADGRSSALIYRVRVDLRDSSSSDIDVLSLVAVPTSELDLAADLRDYYLANTSPAGLIVLLTQPTREPVQKLMSSKSVVSALPARLSSGRGSSGPVLGTVEFNGSVSGIDDLLIQLNTTKFPSAVSFATWLLAEGLSQILHDSDAVHKGSSSFHFKTPSGSHQSQFVVVGEAYHNYARAAFAAVAIWQKTGGGPFGEVLIDTASLSAVGYSVAILQQQYKLRPSPANVRSFRGHAAPRQFVDRWASAPDALFLISASSSGELARRIEATSHSGARAVSMYFLGSAGSAPAGTICDLRLHRNVGDQEDIVPTESHRGPCFLCDEGSALLEITGDSLFPATPQTVARKIGLPDRPDWIKIYGQTLFTRELFALNVSADQRSARAIHFDLARGLNDEHVAGVLLDQFEMQPGERPDVIVHANDEDSLRLAEWWNTSSAGDAVGLVSQESLRSIDELSADRVVVFCSVVASGRSVNEISRALRVVAPNATITYCVGMVRTWSAKRWQNLSSDLRIASGGVRHDVRVGFSCPLPPDHESLIDPWGYEVGVWEEVVVSADQQGLEKLVESIDVRLLELRSGALSSNAFLSHSRCDLVRSDDAADRLSLTAGFAFWEKTWGDADGFQYSQANDADVFVTVASMLNRARVEAVTARDGRLPLLSVDAHNRVVIDPFAFNRYTDGLIQAAILRAAMPRELDYSSSRALSRDISSVVGTIMDASGTDDGAASHEFLLAIASGQLKMRDQDLRSVINRALRRASTLERSNLLRVLAIQCEQRLSA